MYSTCPRNSGTNVGSLTPILKSSFNTTTETLANWNTPSQSQPPESNNRPHARDEIFGFVYSLIASRLTVDRHRLSALVMTKVGEWRVRYDHDTHLSLRGRNASDWRGNPSFLEGTDNFEIDHIMFWHVWIKQTSQTTSLFICSAVDVSPMTYRNHGHY